jgi:tetratricopeptide (TPR) repeat protein
MGSDHKMQVKLDEVGDIFLNGQPVFLEELKQQLSTLQKSGSSIWYYRPGMLESEIPSTLSPERIDAVLQVVIEASKLTQVPIVLSSKPDFSDAIGPDGKSYPLRSETPTKTSEDYLQQGVEKFERGDYQSAIADLQQAIALNPNFAAAYSVLGSTYIEVQDYQNALSCFDHAIQLDPSFREAYGGRALVYNRLGDKQQAVDACTQSIQVDPKFANAYYLRGQINLELGDVPQALTNFEKVIDLYLSGESGHLAVDALPRIQNHYRSGIVYRHSPVEPLVNQAFDAGHKGDFRKALNHLTKAIQQIPNLANLYYHRSAVYKALRQNQNAFDDLSRAIQLNHRVADFYYDRGCMYFDTGNDACIADFNQSIRLDPFLAEAYFNMGSVYASQGNKQDGLSYMQQAATLFQRQGDGQSYEHVVETMRQVGRVL